MGQIEDVLHRVAPRGAPYTANPPFAADESEWFVRGVTEGVLPTRSCGDRCQRYKRSGYRGIDEFLTPEGKERHLFSLPPSGPIYLNREYIAHIGAYAMAILRYGYSKERSSFSRYRKFERDAITRKAGSSYETDAEFYTADDSIYLHVEAKKDAAGVDRIASQMDAADDISEIPVGSVKEIEYVLELTPRYIWVVGPGSIDPPAHVFEIAADGRSASFDRLDELPAPPKSEPAAETEETI